MRALLLSLFLLLPTLAFCESEDLEDELLNAKRELAAKVESIVPTATEAKVDLMALTKNLSENFKTISNEEMTKNLNETLAKTPLASFFKQCPKCVRFLSELMRSDQALTKLTKIVSERQKLLYFSLCMVGTLLLSYIYKRVRKPSRYKILEFISWFKRVILFFVLRLAIFIAFYKAEIMPTWQIFKRIFF